MKWLDPRPVTNLRVLPLEVRDYRLRQARHGLAQILMAVVYSSELHFHVLKLLQSHFCGLLEDGVGTKELFGVAVLFIQLLQEILLLN